MRPAETCLSRSLSNGGAIYRQEKSNIQGQAPAFIVGAVSIGAMAVQAADEGIWAKVSVAYGKGTLEEVDVPSSWMKLTLANFSLERFPSRYRGLTESFPWQAGASHAQPPYIQVQTALRLSLDGHKHLRKVPPQLSNGRRGLLSAHR
jgi:hypothetical protein